MKEYIKCPLCGKEVKRLRQHFYCAKVHKGLDYNKWLSDHPEVETLSESEYSWFVEENRRRCSTPEGRQNMINAANAFWSDPERKAKRIAEIRAQHETEEFKALHREIGRKFMKEKMSTPEGLRQMTQGIKTYGRRTYYTTKTGEVLPLRSHLEECIAIKLDSYPGLEWGYESVAIEWFDLDGEMHHYYPDFYLPDYGIVIEGKPRSLWTREDSVVRKDAAEKHYKFYFCDYDTSILDEIIGSVTTIENITSEKDTGEEVSRVEFK